LKRDAAKRLVGVPDKMKRASGGWRVTFPKQGSRAPSGIAYRYNFAAWGCRLFGEVTPMSGQGDSSWILNTARVGEKKSVQYLNRALLAR
jgi:hypothetical protein